MNQTTVSVSWLALVVVGLVLLGVLAGVASLLSNRHTRGTTKGVLTVGGVGFLLLVAMLFWMRASAPRSHVLAAQQEQSRAQLHTQSAILAQASLIANEAKSPGLDSETAKAQLQQAAALVEEAERMIEAREISPIDGHLRQMKLNEAQHWQQIADGYASTPGVEELATQYQSRANQARADADRIGSAVHSSTRSRAGFGLFFSPVFLLIGGAIVFMAFKHGGTSVGLTVVALPLLLFGFAFLSYSNVSSTSRSSGPMPPMESHNSGFSSSQQDARFVEGLFAEAERNQRQSDVTAKVRMGTGELVTENSAAKVPVESREIALTDDSAAGDDSPTVDAPTGEALVADSPQEVGEDVADPISPNLSADPSIELPDWVQHPPKSVPNVYRQVIESEWRDTAETCQQRIATKLEQTVHEYVQELANEYTHGAYVPSLAELGITPRYIRDEIIKDEFYASRDFGHTDNMVNLYQQLEFDSRVTENLANHWRNYARQQNVTGVAFVSGSVLAAMAGLLGLIKLDTHTKGFYTKRLFIGVPAAIIGAILLANMINW